MDETPTLDDIEAAGRRRSRSVERAKMDTDALLALVIAGLKGGLRPTDVANRSGYTAAYVRKIARENGIEADERYAARAENLRRKS